MSVASQPLLLQAFAGTNTRVPVWFMRQAGRYLPEYQSIKAKHSIEEMFATPEIAAEVTCQPVDILGVDAAILFADILTLPGHMGFRISFDNTKGPLIGNDLAQSGSIAHVHDFEDLSHVSQTVKLVKERLDGRVPLIGFAGAPFTVLTYLIEGGSSSNYAKTFRFMRQKEELCHRLLELLTENTVRYIHLQKEAGIDVFQLFDSWAGILKASDYARFALPYVQRIFESAELPSIYFVRNSNHLLPLMDRSSADFLSVDHTVVLGHHTTIERTRKGIQGNLFNGNLYAEEDVLRREVNDVLIGAQKHDRFIFNLSHGIFPDVEAQKLKLIVEQVHAFPWRT